MNQPHAQGFGRSEFGGGQQQHHRIAIPGPLNESLDCAAAGYDPALGLNLGEPAIVGGDHDIRPQHQFDPGGKGDTTNRRDHGLSAPAPARIGINTILIQVIFPLAPHRGCLWQVQTGGEMPRVAENNPDPQIGVLVQQAIGILQLAKHARRQTVAFFAPVDPYQQGVAPPFNGDLAIWVAVGFGLNGAGHCLSPPGWAKVCHSLIGKAEQVPE